MSPRKKKNYDFMDDLEQEEMYDSRIEIEEEDEDETPEINFDHWDY